jgi:hypothetical protein
LWPFWYIFPVLVCCTRKNLAPCPNLLSHLISEDSFSKKIQFQLKESIMSSRSGFCNANVWSIPTWGRRTWRWMLVPGHEPAYPDANAFVFNLQIWVWNFDTYTGLPDGIFSNQKSWFG